MRTCDSGLPNLVNRADASSAFMCCGFRFKDSTCKPREECAKVAKAIKGTSAHSINRKLHSHEAVWQEESFDHVLRSSESLDAKIDYVLQNPVRKGWSELQENIRGRGGSQWIIRTGHVGAGALTRPAMRSIARRWRARLASPDDGVRAYGSRGGWAQ